MPSRASAPAVKPPLFSSPSAGPRVMQVRREHRHCHHVVRDRRPHHRSEAPAGVEHLPDQHEHPVEEHLRQAVAREGDHRVALLGQRGSEELGIEEQPHQQRSTHDEQHRHDREEQPGEGHDPVGVGLPAVRVVLHRPHQLRHQHGVHHAARQQDVEHVRDGVGDVEHVGVQSDAECRGEQDAAHEAAQPGHHRPGGHHRGRGEQRSRVGPGVAPSRHPWAVRGRADGAWGFPPRGPPEAGSRRPRPYATGGLGGAARSGARSSRRAGCRRAARMYQISRPTWLVRRLNVSGVPVVSPAVVTGKIVTSWTPTPLVTWSRRVVRCPGCMLTGSGVATLTVGLSARARSPTVIGCFSPLTRVTVSEPEPPESVTKSVPVTWTSLHLRARGGVELEDLGGGEPRRRPGAEGRRLQRGTGQPVGHAVLVGEQVGRAPRSCASGSGWRRRSSWPSSLARCSVP